MKPEIEVKFLDVNHDELRLKLIALGAVQKQPMRLMRRSIIDYSDRRLQTTRPTWGFIRVRDEGGKATLTYKQITDDAKLTTHEVEVEVSSYETTVEFFKTIGLNVESVQESRRESWKYKGCDIELDEWPWLKPYLEIEGPDEATLQDVAIELGFVWEAALHGGANEAYRREYPGITATDTVGNIPVMEFDSPLPQWLIDRKALQAGTQ